MISNICQSAVLANIFEPEQRSTAFQHHYTPANHNHPKLTAAVAISVSL